MEMGEKQSLESGVTWSAGVNYRVWLKTRDSDLVLFPSRTGTCLYFPSAARSCLTATSLVDNINQGLFG